MKPSERIKEIYGEIRNKFDEENPYFFLDNGYLPDLEKRATWQYLDEEWEKEVLNCEGCQLSRQKGDMICKRHPLK